MLTGEQQLIQDVFAPLTKSAPGAFGLRDDAAILTSDPEKDIVITTDAVVEGTHFLSDDPPDLVARKALRTNLSDLAAKAAEPGGYLVTLATPKRCDRDWIEKFASGLAADQNEFGCYLLGGDTVRTSGPVTVSITATGSVSKDGMKRRNSAAAGELIYVTGTIGDSFLGLQVRAGEQFAGTASAEQRRFLAERYQVPTPRVGLIPAVRAYASAAMDVSDGLAGDLALLCAASGVSAQVDLTQVALSDAARAVMNGNLATLEDLMSGGDDYELLLSVKPNSVYALESAARRQNLQVSRIGRVVAGDAPPVFYGPGETEILFERASYSHVDYRALPTCKSLIVSGHDRSCFFRTPD